MANEIAEVIPKEAIVVIVDYFSAEKISTLFSSYGDVLESEYYKATHTSLKKVLKLSELLQD